VLTVVAIIGILAAIATPSWLQYVANRRVTAARDEIHLGITSAQSLAIANRGSWRFSIRDTGDHLEWTTHPDSVSWQDVTVWNALHSSVMFYDSDTTLLKKEGTYYTRFGFKGEVTVRLGTVTLDSRDGIAKNKCVVISTLIGATRKGEEHPYKNGNRYCY
jgi:Tfp pilus assembly protein FimT